LTSFERNLGLIAIKWKLPKNPQKRKIALCAQFSVHTEPPFADIAYFGLVSGRFKGYVHTDEHSKLNNRGRLGEPIPNKKALNPVLRTGFHEGSARMWTFYSRVL